MTVILGISSEQFCFFASDTARFDLVYKTRLEPVQKLLVSNDMVVTKAGAGSVVDPHLSAAFVKSISSSPSLTGLWSEVRAHWVNMVSAQQAVCTKNRVAYTDPGFILIAGARSLAGCECGARVFPASKPRKPGKYGILAFGKDEPAVVQDAEATMSAMLSGNASQINLTHWASEIMERAEARSAPIVGFPIDCALLRSDSATVAQIRLPTPAASRTCLTADFEVAAEAITRV